MIRQDKAESNKKNYILYLFILITISVSIRLYFLPFEIPFKTDAIDYFSFAFEISKTQKFPTGILGTNDGWPLFLSPIFSVIGQSDMMTLINAQRVTSIVISSLTIIPVFFLCKKFVSPNFALIGACLFVFSHRIMENSILGITESLFIFLTTFFLLFSLTKNSKVYVLSFVCLALSSIVRYESLLFLVPISIIFFLKFHKKKSDYLKFPLFILLFVLILIPIATIRMDNNNMDGLTSHVFGGIMNPAKYSSISENETGTSIQSENNFIINSFFHALKFLGLVSIPLFIFFIPSGFYNLVKTADAVASNLRGDVPEKLGLTYLALKDYNPKVVCAHLSAYGRSGPRSNWPGFDYLMQAEAGFFSLTGEPDAPPARFGLSVVDQMTGLALAYALTVGIIGARAIEIEPEKSPFSFTIIRLPVCLGDDPHV